MSSNYPPSGPPNDGAEYLDLGSGGPLERSAGGRRSALVVGGAVAAVALLGAGAWAAWSFFATGAQPAQALPDSTVAYVSIDLDPSGGQKIAALQTLQEFPAFEDEIGLDTDDDIRKWVFEEVQGSGACADLDYADEVEPWLGDRFAAAAVDSGGDFPDMLFVVQVKDEDAADTGLAKLRDCGGEDLAWAIADGWALVGETQEIVDGVAADAADASLSDDEDFTHWTGEAGDAGIATMYLAPEAGELLAEYLEGLGSLGGFGGLLGDGDDFASSSSGSCTTDEEGNVVCTGADVTYSGSYSTYSSDGECPAPCTGLAVVPDELTDQLTDFRGMAATVRFADGSLEIEVAADAGDNQTALSGSGGAGDLVGSLPEDTAVAIGVGLAEGWFTDLLGEDVLQMVENETGLELPEDAETLLGEAAAVSIGGDFDPEGFLNGDGPPVGLKVRGDAAAIEDVLTRIQPHLDDELVLAVDSDGALVAIGPDADYRGQLLEDGGLGDTDLFRDAVPDADDADTILFVSFDAGDWLDQLADSDAEVAENLRPLAALGVSGWLEDDTSHVVLRVTTD